MVAAEQDVVHLVVEAEVARRVARRPHRPQRTGRARDEVAVLQESIGFGHGEEGLHPGRPETSLQAIGRRVRVPAQVLKPAFDTTRTDGYLTGDDNHLHVTDAGEREIRKLVTATHDWLAAELADWGTQDDELLTRALDDMAKQVIDQDSDLAGSPVAAALPAPPDAVCSQFTDTARVNRGRLLTSFPSATSP